MLCKVLVLALQLCHAAALLSAPRPIIPGRAPAALHAVAYPSAQFQLEYVKTDGSPDTKHNFGPASPLDTVLYTAERPGNPPTKDIAEIGVKEVKDWIEFIRGQGVTQVISLLNDSELELYEKPGLVALLEEGGIQCYVAPMGEKYASETIMNLIQKAEEKNEKIVCHCTGGVGRCGRVAAAWLVHRYNLSPEVATLTVLDQAFKSGVKRLGHTEKLRSWLNYTA